MYFTHGSVTFRI